jgi:hypothetical protein
MVNSVLSEDVLLRHLLVVVRLVVVNNKVNGTGIEDSIKTLGAGLGDGARDLRANGVLDERRHRECSKRLSICFLWVSQSVYMRKEI